MARLIKVDVKKILQFFDEAPEQSQGHATAISLLAGEDLNAGVFKQFMEEVEGAEVRILDTTVSTGRRKGPRLDRWIEVIRPNGRRILFQSEIKSWSAHAIWHIRVPLDASESEMKQLRKKYWDVVWNQRRNQPRGRSMTKVLTPMQYSIDEALPRPATILPILIMWCPLHPYGKDECFFAHDVGRPGSSNKRFKKLFFFSVSTYLRSLGEKNIVIPAPSAIARMQWLNELFSV